MNNCNCVKSFSLCCIAFPESYTESSCLCTYFFFNLEGAKFTEDWIDNGEIQEAGAKIRPPPPFA